MLPKEKLDGLRFVYKHWRVDPEGVLRHYQRGITDWTPQGKGGATKCFVYEGDRLVSMGATECSRKDNFCYRSGRHRARFRALLHLDLQ